MRIPVLAVLCSGCLVSSAPYERRKAELEADGPVPTDTDAPTDADPPAPDACFVDVDGDGHGAGPSVGVAPCAALTVPTADDCDDERADVYPNAPEACDGADQDCLGGTDAGRVSVDGVPYASLQAALDAVNAQADFDGEGASVPVDVCGGPGDFGLHVIDGLGSLSTAWIRGRAVAGQRPVLRTNGARFFEGAADTTLQDLVLDGAGSPQAGSGGCMRILSPATVALGDVDITGCHADADGGAVFVESGAQLVVQGGAFVGNDAARGGAIALAPGANLDSYGAHFEGNQATDGGAILAGGTLYLGGDDSFVGNIAASEGGAVWAAQGGTVDGTFQGNLAPQGAAAWLEGGDEVYFSLGGTYEDNGAEQATAVRVGAEVYVWDLTISGYGTGLSLATGSLAQLFYTYLVFDGNDVGIQRDPLTTVYFESLWTGENGVDVLDGEAVIDLQSGEYNYFSCAAGYSCVLL